jgi:hypothetical protein
MKPLKDITTWPAIAVYDIEAVNWVDVVCIGHVDEFDNRKWFVNMTDYLIWLFSGAFKGDHVWAHWGGHYDHRFVIYWATQQIGWSWQTVQSGNLLIIIKVVDPNGRTINFCESARLMPDSVEKIGNTVGLKKLDVDRTHMEKLTFDETIEYCLRDCDIVLRGLQYMKEALTAVGADFAYTLASISTRWVRKSDVLEWIRFYDRDRNGNFEYSKAMLEADDFCLPAYFGGRVEVFKTGTYKQDLYYYDITSSYPWSMTHSLPTYFKGFYAPPRDLVDALEHYGVSEATVFIPKNSMHIPILPVRNNGKLLFPEGHIKGRWTNLELKALWDRGKYRGVKIQIHGQARFHELAFLKPFVETFYSLRNKAKEDNDAFRSYTYKIALNSLYGKLVEAVDRLSILYGKMVNESIDKYGASAVSPTATPGIYKLETINLGPFRHVAAGSYVTALSRLRLLEGMETCVNSGGKIYYCDTDSIVTDKKISAFQTDKSELGGFGLEHELIEGEFICPKVYRVITKEGKEIFKVKGMPIKGLTPEENKIRWDSYIAGIDEKAQARLNDLNLSDAELIEYSSKEGIAGFMMDLNKGSIKPNKQKLQRKMRNRDSKRVHVGGFSDPLYLENT